jgi:hypothetical protein
MMNLFRLDGLPVSTNSGQVVRGNLAKCLRSNEGESSRSCGWTEYKLNEDYKCSGVGFDRPAGQSLTRESSTPWLLY